MNEQVAQLHYVCFVEKKGVVYELDGRNDGVVSHGASELLDGAAEAIKHLVSISPDKLNFSILAFGGE